MAPPRKKKPRPSSTRILPVCLPEVRPGGLDRTICAERIAIPGCMPGKDLFVIRLEDDGLAPDHPPRGLPRAGQIGQAGAFRSGLRGHDPPRRACGQTGVVDQEMRMVVLTDARAKQPPYRLTPRNSACASWAGGLGVPGILAAGDVAPLFVAALVGTPAIPASPGPEQAHEQISGHESAHMGEKGHRGALPVTCGIEKTGKKLEEEPYPQKDRGRKLGDEGNDEDGDERHHPGMRKQPEIGPHHPGHGPRGPITGIVDEG